VGHQMSKGPRYEIVASSSLPSSPSTSLPHSTRQTRPHSLNLDPSTMSGYIFTPPPTPPKRSYLSLNSPPLSPPDSPLSIFTSYPPHLNPAYRSRCNSEETLNNNDLLFENKGFEKIGGAEKEVRVEVKVKIGLGETRESLQSKIELALIGNEGDKQEEEGGKGVVAEKSELEREQGDGDKV